MPILILKPLNTIRVILGGATYGQRNDYKNGSTGNTEHQLYTILTAPLTKAGAGTPLECFNTCTQDFTGNTNFT